MLRHLSALSGLQVAMGTASVETITLKRSMGSFLLLDKFFSSSQSVLLIDWQWFSTGEQTGVTKDWTKNLYVPWDVWRSKHFCMSWLIILGCMLCRPLSPGAHRLQTLVLIVQICTGRDAPAALLWRGSWTNQLLSPSNKVSIQASLAHFSPTLPSRSSGCCQ